MKGDIMLTTVEKNATMEKVADTTQIGVYTIYDTVLKQFDLPLSVPTNKIVDYMNILINDPNSKYWNHESDYILNQIGTFDETTGFIDLKFIERVAVLDTFVDRKKRKLQTIIQTLNYLPSGYFKMPEEMKIAIQEKIDEHIKTYVENYVLPDLDVNDIKVMKEQV